ncbi:MAG: PLP-dependent aminotransferase family protein [Candidatus Melainabacteria bacterium]|nr:MAG: PLP-dependent aminotransferase family protein [Candidatus Melainabacteria bacterium]
MPRNRQTNNSESSSPLANFAVSLHLDDTSPIPIYEQIADQLAHAIESLVLMPGQLMPSTRQLADYLQISRKTVVRSYDKLIGQGFLTTTRGIGTLVRASIAKPPALPANESAPLKLSAFAERLLQIPPTALSCGAFAQLNHGAPAPETLPVAQWKQIINSHANQNENKELTNGLEPFGQPELRKAVTAYLKRQRAIQCDHKRVIAHVDSTTPTRLATQLTIDPGDLVAIEDPGYPYARRCFQMLGAELVAIPVDNDGMQVERLIDENRAVKAVYVTPSHQDPYGGTLSLARRHTLLKWANRTGALIFEDDYENEFFYGNSNLPSLYSLDQGDRVIYLSSFYKTLFPLSDAGITVLPERLIEAFRRAQELYSGVSSSLSIQEQVGLTKILDDGTLERQIRKAQSLYQKRRHIMISAITSQLKGLCDPMKITGAMTIVIRFDQTLNHLDISECAQQTGFPLATTEAYYWQNPPKNEFLTSFAMLEESTIMPVVEDFTRRLKERRQAR